MPTATVTPPSATATAATAPALLTSRQMAEFVATGMLRFDGLLDAATCRRAMTEIRENRFEGSYRHGIMPLDAMWPDLAVGDALRHPVVAGAIRSLIGPGPRFDHMAAHLVPADTRRGPNLHQDAEWDGRLDTFDIQLSFFFQDITPEMGGTLFVPGSHFRRIRVHAASRYHHVRGQVQTVCPAGSVVIWHHNLWHAACSNTTDQDRYMFKVRLNPQVPQRRLWDCRDLGDPEIPAILSQGQPWHGVEDRAEIINRIRLWRALTGDASWDINSWMTRMACDGRYTMGH